MDVDTLPYTEEEASSLLEASNMNNLASRIGRGRVYLMSESSAGLNARLDVRSRPETTR